MQGKQLSGRSLSPQHHHPDIQGFTVYLLEPGEGCGWGSGGPSVQGSASFLHACCMHRTTAHIILIPSLCREFRPWQRAFTWVVIHWIANIGGVWYDSYFYLI